MITDIAVTSRSSSNGRDVCTESFINKHLLWNEAARSRFYRDSFDK